MVCTWFAHGLHMVCTWFAHGLLMVCTWFVHGVVAPFVAVPADRGELAWVFAAEDAHGEPAPFVAASSPATAPPMDASPTSSSVCAICMAAPVSAVYVPCGHSGAYHARGCRFWLGDCAWAVAVHVCARVCTFVHVVSSLCACECLCMCRFLPSRSVLRVCEPLGRGPQNVPRVSRKRRLHRSRVHVTARSIDLTRLTDWVVRDVG